MKIKGVTYYTSAELARYFEVRPSTVRKWVERGHLAPSIKVEGRRGPINVFREEDVQALAQKRYGA